jgi:hypothetical protein
VRCAPLQAVVVKERKNKMGAPAGGFDTSKVWSPAGGWFADPKHWRRNTFFGFVAAGVAGAVIFNYSRKIEVRGRSSLQQPPNTYLIHLDLKILARPLPHSWKVFPFGKTHTETRRQRGSANTQRAQTRTNARD